MGKQSYNSTYSYPQHYADMSDHPHAPDVLPPLPIASEARCALETVLTWQKKNLCLQWESNPALLVMQPTASFLC